MFLSRLNVIFGFVKVFVLGWPKQHNTCEVTIFDIESDFEKMGRESEREERENQLEIRRRLKGDL